jgi:hypothetical protein
MCANNPKIWRGSSGRSGWALNDLIVVLCVLFGLLLLASIMLPMLARARFRPRHITCVGTLKQIGTAYRVWAGDNNDLMPWEVSTNEGGWKEYAFSREAGKYCWTNYAIMANELGQSPRVVLCPAETERQAATNFEAGSFGNSNLSYFVGINAGGNYPQSWLGGDRNIAPSDKPRDDYGYSPSNNLGNNIVLSTSTTKTRITWSRKLHFADYKKPVGNLVLGDSSAQLVSADRLRSECQPYAGVPSVYTTNDSPSNSLFRLVFP